jgi:8-oxo-dGTP pyrophosphatase MutT (NUDIX family)
VKLGLILKIVRNLAEVKSNCIMLFNRNNKKPTHAGGVIFREKKGYKEFLLVSAKKFPFIWVLPKGHIEATETEEQAAVREVKEESGMKASIIRKIGNSQRWQWNFKKQVVTFYLMKYEKIYSKNKENRKIKWVSFDVAIQKLFYSDQRQILRQIKLVARIPYRRTQA